MNERLLLIMEHFNYSPSLFADEIGVIRSSISHIISGRNNPGLELLQKVLIRFPMISSDWLILGRGEMLLTAEELDRRRVTNVNYNNKLGQLNLDDLTQINMERPVMSSTIPVHERILKNIENGKKTSDAIDGEPILNKTHEGPLEAENLRIEKGRSVQRIILYYDDNSFQEFTENHDIKK